MFDYYLRLALKSLRRNPVISGLMVVTIALGIGVSTTTATIYHIMARNPIPEKSDQLFYVRMDNWINGPYGYREPEDPPEQITYQDAVRLLEDARGTYQSASYNTYVLVYAPYLKTISFIVVIASTVQFVEMVIKKLSPPLYRALGIFLPLITTNCAILGLALFSTNRGYGFVQGLIYALGAGGGLTLALVLMAGLREEAELSSIPSVIKGTAMSLIIAGILSLAFMGFAGLFSS